MFSPTFAFGFIYTGHGCGDDYILRGRSEVQSST
jgi:hypothetical protein